MNLINFELKYLKNIDTTVAFVHTIYSHRYFYIWTKQNT